MGGYHSVKGFTIDGFVLCLLYEHGDAACKLDMWFEVSSNFMFHDCSEFKFCATNPSRVCPSTDSCCVSYMKTRTLRASWTCGLKSAQTSCSMIVLFVAFFSSFSLLFFLFFVCAK